MYMAVLSCALKFVDGRPTPMSDVRYVRYKKRAALHVSLCLSYSVVMAFLLLMCH